MPTSQAQTIFQAVGKRQNIACHLCSLSKLCIPMGVQNVDLEKLDEIIVRHDPLKRGEHWYRAGDPFTSIYAVRSGCLKTYVLSGSGAEHICGFHLPGEIIGLDAIEAGFYKSSAKVLQACSVCEIPFERLNEIFDDAPSLQRQLLRIMSKEIYNEQWLITLLGKTSADERVAAFLCNLSNRFAVRGYSPHEFVLGMPRHDIGNYLGLAVETVCRVFTRFQKEKLLTAKGKQINIHKLKQLYELAGTLQIPPYVN
jgi:CRP/FNR family transcriptional regulator